MTKKKPPKLVMLPGGAEPPSADSVEGTLRAALQAHKTTPFSDVFVVGVLSGRAHVINTHHFHYSRDRVRLLGVLQWSVAVFMRKYFS